MRAVFPDPDRLRRWATAVALAALAVAAQWAARPWVGTKLPFLFFLPAIVAAASRAGRAAGLFVTGVGFISAWLWLLPRGPSVGGRFRRQPLAADLLDPGRAAGHAWARASA